MNKLLRFLVGFLVPGLMLTFATMNPAMAQAKAKAAAPKVVLKVLFENEKVRAYEARFKPGAEGENVDRPASVIRALKGGTIQRIYPDGKKENTVWKTGEVKWLPARTAYVPKNIGKSEVVLYVVALK